MIKNPLVSVLMPVYNAERYVAEAVESILTQTFTDFEFLIIDDGSTDGSLAILQRYAQQDARIRLISRPNTGITPALNEMIALSRGEFLARMDADDISLPTRLEEQLQYLLCNPQCVAVSSVVDLIDPEGAILTQFDYPADHSELEALLLKGISPLFHPATTIRKSAIDTIGYYNEEARFAEDYELFIRLSEVGYLHNIKSKLLLYRVHDHSIGYTKRRLQLETVRKYRNNALAKRGLAIPVDAEESMEVHFGIANSRRRWAWWALGSGNVKTARKHAIAGFVREPLARESWKVLYCALRGH